MFFKFLITAIFSISLSTGVIAQEAAGVRMASTKLDYLNEVAEHMNIAYGFKQGIKFEKSKGGKINELAEAALSLDDRVLNKIFAEVLENRLTLDEAKQAYAFHSSEAGIAAVKAQSKDILNPRPKINLTPAQKFAVTMYMNSATGKKVGALVADPLVWDEYTRRVFATLSKQ